MVAPLSLGPRLTRSFFERDVCEVASPLVGAVLARREGGALLAGVIVETEAYRGPEDLAAHSAGGRRTARTEVMYGPAGHAYVFVVYGRNWAFNVVTGRPGEPHAVLVRALEPLVGVELMRGRRGGVPERLVASGPGRLCQALGVGRESYGHDLCAEGSPLSLHAPLTHAPARLVVATPRIGVDYAGEWASRPMRFVDPASPHLSRRVGAASRATTERRRQG